MSFYTYPINSNINNTRPNGAPDVAPVFTALSGPDPGIKPLVKKKEIVSKRL
jgi:hypothetical protein